MFTKGITAEQVGRMTVTQLKERLRSAGLKVSGRKTELIARLCEHEAGST